MAGGPPESGGQRRGPHGRRAHLRQSGQRGCLGQPEPVRTRRYRPAHLLCGRAAGLFFRNGPALGQSHLRLGPDRELSRFNSLIRQPYGIILVTGPTGSGKTTTLYSALHDINSPDKKIITVEDPVEYELDGINQVQVNTTAGLTFARGLRSIVRQDPDVILIGEIRDQETADIAI